MKLTPAHPHVPPSSLPGLLLLDLLAALPRALLDYAIGRPTTLEPATTSRPISSTSAASVSRSGASTTPPPGTTAQTRPPH